MLNVVQCIAGMQGVEDSLWYPMQHDDLVEHDTAAALEGLDLTATAAPPLDAPRAMSSDLECIDAQGLDDWQGYDVAKQQGLSPPPRVVLTCHHSLSVSRSVMTRINYGRHCLCIGWSYLLAG